MAAAAAAVALVVVIAVRVTDGGRDGSPTAGGGAPGAASARATAAAPGSEPAPALRGLVGSGCADYAAAAPSGAGSIAAMRTESLTAALAGNPLLKTFVQGVTGRLNRQVSLAGSLDGGELTVFAPIDSAFAKVPAATLQKVTLNPTTLRKVLSHLVVRGQLTPSQASGSHLTLAGDTLAVTNASGQLAVGAAQVVCGGLRTANATIYLIDAVPSLRG